MNIDSTSWHTLFDSMHVGIVFQNHDGNITEANRAAETLLGLEFDELRGRTSTHEGWKAIHKDGSTFEGDKHPAMVALKTGKEVKDVVMGVYQPEKDQHIWLLVNAHPQFNNNDQVPSQVFTTYVDITDQIIAEKKVARKNEMDYRRRQDKRWQELFARFSLQDTESKIIYRFF